MKTTRPRKKKRFLSKKKRILDRDVVIDYKRIDILKRFVTERGKIIPRRISGASSMQQRRICTEVKRARFLALLPYSISHKHEKGFLGEAAMYAHVPLALRQRSDFQPQT